MVVEKNKEQYFIIDVLKLMFSFCIIALHTNLFLKEYPTLYWYSSHVIWRIAVPFFFITSGYFFCKKIKSSQHPKEVLKHTIKRLTILLSFWLLITLPLEIKQLLIQNLTTKQIIIELLRKVLFYPWGALWYIWALIISYLLIYPFIRKNCYKLPLLLGGLLYLFAILANSYYFVIENTFLQVIIDKYLSIFISTRNGIFLGFFYIAIANYLTIKKTYSKKKNIILLTVGIIGLIFEATIIRNHHYIEDHSLFFSLLLIAPSLFELAKSFKVNKNGRTIRNLSIGIYVLHRPILGYLNYFFHLEEKLSSIELFIIILLLSIVISYLLQKVNNKYINKVIT